MTTTITKTRTRITERAGGTTAATMLQPNKTSQVKSNSQSGSHTSPLFTHHCIFARVFFYTYKLFVGCYCCCCFYNFRLVENKQRNRWTRTGWWCLGVVTEKHTMDREEADKEKRKNTSSDRNALWLLDWLLRLLSHETLVAWPQQQQRLLFYEMFFDRRAIIYFQ